MILDAMWPCSVVAVSRRELSDALPGPKDHRPTSLAVSPFIGFGPHSPGMQPSAHTTRRGDDREL